MAHEKTHPEPTKSSCMTLVYQTHDGSCASAAQRAAGVQIFFQPVDRLQDVRESRELGGQAPDYS